MDIPQIKYKKDFRFILNEEALIYFQAEFEEEQDSIVLFATDIALPPTSVSFNANRVCYKWHAAGQARGKKPFFRNLFGECSLSIKSQAEGGSQKETEFATIEIAGNKISQENAAKMIGYIANQAPSSILSPLSAVTYSSNNATTNEFDYLTFLKEVEYGIKTIQLALPTLLKRPISRLVPNKKIESTFGTPNYGAANFDWLVNRLDVLTPSHVNDHSAIEIGSKFFVPSELEIDKPEEDVSVYENKIVIGYIALLKDFLDRFIKKFDINITQSFFEETDHVLLFELIKRECSKKLTSSILKAKTMLSSVVNLEEQLNLSFNEVEGLSSPPIFTEKVRSNFVYRSLFERVAAWHSLGQPDWDGLVPTGIKSIDQIYEIYCYLKVVNTLKQLGFEEITDNVDLIDFDSGHCIMLESDLFSVECHYEKPFFSTQKSPSNARYVHIEQWNSRTMEERKGTGKFSMRLPDISLIFTMKNSPYKSSLIVLDAKYTSSTYAFKKYLPECVMKYIHGIAPTEKDKGKIAACYLLNSGRDNEKKVATELHYAVESYNLYSKTPHIPAIGTIQVSPNKTEEIVTFVKGLFSIAQHALKT